ncbi:MAG TPA: c-type cytochrome domain-containing protein, partial [Caldilineaceae bacterium]|nr:c-type cytochrome domain-containing protein [Caldilineaceae bacterium]
MNEQSRPHRGRRWAGWVAAAALVVAGVALAVVVWGSRLLDSLVNGGAPVTAAVVDNTSPAALAERRGQELARLNSYGWVDPEAKIAHIPIERAMALVVESGLPVGEPSAAAEPGEGQDAGDEEMPPVDLATVNYQDHVLPIFEARCGECHGAEDPEEGLELTRYRTALAGSQNGPVIEPGDPEGSYLVELIVEGKMPKEGEPLSQREIDTIIAWIEAGAPETAPEGAAPPE